MSSSSTPVQSPARIARSVFSPPTLRPVKNATTGTIVELATAILEGKWTSNKTFVGRAYDKDNPSHQLAIGTFFINKKQPASNCSGEGMLTLTTWSRFEGEFSDFLPHGVGKLTQINGVVIMGNFEKGEPQGEVIATLTDGGEFNGTIQNEKWIGRVKMPSGCTYKGSLRNGFFHGRGVLTSENGIEMRGAFAFGKPLGEVTRYKKGELTLGVLEGDYFVAHKEISFMGGPYLGQLKEGVPHGFGHHDLDEYSYSGDFEEGIPHGRGHCQLTPLNQFEDKVSILSKKHQARLKPRILDYKGMFNNGLITGEGKATFVGGFTFEGPFYKNKMCGYGKLTTFSGTVYLGEFYKTALMTGEGEKISKNGSHYKGELVNNRRHGKGVHTNRSGTYEGDFYHNKRHGYAKITDHSGNTFCGFFKLGKPKGLFKCTNALDEVSFVKINSHYEIKSVAVSGEAKQPLSKRRVVE